MNRSRLNYQEGNWFVVPLRGGGFAPGIVARVGKKGVFLGYFFGPRYDAPPTLREVLTNGSGTPILVALVGDLGLLKGEWKLLGKASDWRREQWPIPAFRRRDAVSGGVSHVTYAEDNLLTEKELVPSTEEATMNLPSDGVWGFGAIESRLSKLLSNDRRQTY